MSEGHITFDALVRSTDPGACIASMSDRKLGVIITWLAAYSAGIPAMLLAMADSEAARRWHAAVTTARQTTDGAGAMGEGFLP